VESHHGVDVLALDLTTFGHKLAETACMLADSNFLFVFLQEDASSIFFARFASVLPGFP
jgi:hypothetical protein